MKVFLNWSGEESRRIAGLLRDWLPEILDAVEPWLAADTFGRSNHWLEVNAGPFTKAGMIVACVTPANSGENWKSLDPSDFELSIAETPPQLVLLLGGVDVSSLQRVPAGASVITADRQGIQLLVEKLNGLADRPMDYTILGRRIDAMWPRLERSLPAAEKLTDDDKSVNLEDTVKITDSIDVVVVHGNRGVTSADIDKLHEQIAQLTDAFVGLRERVAPTLQVVDEPAEGTTGKPRLFIGSSVEGKRIAEEIQVAMEYEVETVLWTQEVFKPSSTTMESLHDVARTFQFAVIVMTADDVLIKRGIENKAPRDNLVYEAGLFGGILGRARTFVVHPRDDEIDFPSDFAGVTLISFEIARSDGNLSAAVGPACTRIKRAMGV